MATISPMHPPVESQKTEVTEEQAREAFLRYFGRMKGTMIITGDIVNRDPELWDCERD